MLHKISIIAFDLDDTLWPCMPTINHAEETLFKWLELHYPLITNRYSADEMLELRKQFTHQNPEFAIDLSRMRYEFLRFLALECGYDLERVASDGFDVFYEARQNVCFYDDVFPNLERLLSRYRLGAISNGNASIEKVGLGHLIEHAVSASELKVAKPDKLIYQNLADRFNVPAEQILYVGDDPVFDVIGPLEAGFQAVWINRDARTWPEHLPDPEYQISGLDELDALMP